MVLQFPCCISRGPSLDGKKVSGKFAFIIGQYMQKYNFKILLQMSALFVCVCVCLCLCLGKVHSTTFHPTLKTARFTFISFISEMKLKTVPILGWGGVGGYIQQLFILNSEMKDLH